MKVSYSWLKQYVNIDLDVKILADKLSMAGLVVEGIEQIGDDFVVEFERLPNRPDWLNVIGIARETSAVCDVDKIKQDILLNETDKNINEHLQVEIADSDLCPRYCARMVENIKIGPSPDWLVDRLEKSGIRSINNVVDVTNYVLLEYGHPLHAFDYENIQDKKIIIRRASNGEQITSLDEEERKLDDTILVIADTAKSVAIGGVMGGGNSEVTQQTQTIVLESAYFDPSSIRQTSKKLGLSSESSYRFERGADVDIVPVALDRAAQLIAELAGGSILQGVIDQYPCQIPCNRIEARTSQINSIIGIDISDQEIIAYLEKLDLDVVQEEEGLLIVNIPNFRRELIREEDIAEEVARLYGYDNIEITMPNTVLAAYDIDPAELLKRNLKKRLMANGLTEVINYSFISKSDQKEYKEGSIRLQHPLADTQAVMRRTLMPGMLKNLCLNLNHNNRDFNVYEIGKTYYVKDDNACEDYYLSIVSLCDFLDLKGIIQDVLAYAGIKEAKFVVQDNLWCEPGFACSVQVAGQELGFVGMLANAKKNAFDIKDVKLKIAVAEINLEKVLSIEKPKKKYQQISKFPASKRDLALIMKEEITYKEVVGFINEVNQTFDCDIELFDTYRGEQVPDGCKSMAFALSFKSDERTLTDAEVDVVFHEIIVRFQNDKGIVLREG